MAMAGRTHAHLDGQRGQVLSVPALLGRMHASWPCRLALRSLFSSSFGRESEVRRDLNAWAQRPCLDHLQISNFFTLSVISIFGRIHGALNVGKKITNCIV